jgi:hypothetical protein
MTGEEFRAAVVPLARRIAPQGTLWATPLTWAYLAGLALFALAVLVGAWFLPLPTWARVLVFLLGLVVLSLVAGLRGSVVQIDRSPYLVPDSFAGSARWPERAARARTVLGLLAEDREEWKAVVEANRSVKTSLSRLGPRRRHACSATGTPWPWPICTCSSTTRR